MNKISFTLSSNLIPTMSSNNTAILFAMKKVSLKLTGNFSFILEQKQITVPIQIIKPYINHLSLPKSIIKGIITTSFLWSLFSKKEVEEGKRRKAW